MSVQAITHTAKTSHSPSAVHALQSAYAWASTSTSDDEDQEVTSERTNTPAAVHALAEVLARLSAQDGEARPGQADEHLLQVYSKLQARFSPAPAEGRTPATDGAAEAEQAVADTVAAATADTAGTDSATADAATDSAGATRLAADQSPFERAVEPSRYSLAESFARMIEALGLPLWREPTEKGLAPGSLLHLDA